MNKEHSAVKSINFVQSLNQCISSDIIHRKRGKRTGIKVKIKNRSYRIPFPTINFGNVLSITDESKQVQLHSNILFMHQFKNMCVLALTETWLEESDPDEGIHLEGFSLYRCDRDTVVTYKAKGGGV